MNEKAEALRPPQSPGVGDVQGRPDYDLTPKRKRRPPVSACSCSERVNGHRVPSGDATASIEPGAQKSTPCATT